MAEEIDCRNDIFLIGFGSENKIIFGIEKSLVLGGWAEGSKTGFKDCLQHSSILDDYH